MATRKLLPLFAVLALTAIGSTANANVISLSPVVQTAGIGQEVSFDINMDFINTTVGGAFDLFYDPNLLAFVSFEFDATFLTSVADPDFAIMPDNCISDGAALGGCSAGDAELNAIGFGSFDGISGSHTIGTVTFQTLGPGVSALLMATTDSPWEGFISADDASDLFVIYSPAKLHVVPLPAGLWLLASGLGLFAGFARRRRS